LVWSLIKRDAGLAIIHLRTFVAVSGKLLELKGQLLVCLS
jgi:hypothetical protein